MRSLFDDTLDAKFREFHELNPEVYDAFDRFTREALRAGARRLGAKLVWERIRWYTQIEARGTAAEGFKLNNNYHAFYARLWMQRNPQHSTLFETRRQRSSA